MTSKTQSYRTYLLKQRIVPYLFLTPNLLIFSIFIILPAIIGVYYSFTDMSLFTFGRPEIIGFDNYRRLLDDELFKNAMWNTIKLVIVTVPLLFATALMVATLIVQPIKAKGFFRAIYYWPVMISAIVVGVIWQWIFSQDFGLLNVTLQSLGLDPMQTFINPTFAWWSVVFAIVWSRTGYYMIIFVAALLSIPETLYEAAEMDGANKLQKFLFITYPSLKAARLMVFILVTMEIFKIYPLVVTLTGGGPFKATEFTVQHIYETAFKRYDIGYASAMSVVMLLIVTLFTAFNFFSSKRGENK
ncbi:MAG: sugar ABC transporter permease [Bacillota bacterium]|nr:MAG: sugar ABC transporter permease [Bacillota bacterium]